MIDPKFPIVFVLGLPEFPMPKQKKINRSCWAHDLLGWNFETHHAPTASNGKTT